MEPMHEGSGWDLGWDWVWDLDLGWVWDLDLG
jgi:hypothetical protein